MKREMFEKVLQIMLPGSEIVVYEVLPRNQLNENNELNFVDFNQTYQYNQTFPNDLENYSIEKNLQPLLLQVSQWLDYLWLISSSHTFFIFIFKCNLIKFSFRWKN